MSAILPRQIQKRTEKGLALLGVGLNDAREEAFVLMVCDGIAIGVAFKRAGFTSANTNAPTNLFHLDRIQKRANEIMEARRTTNVVTLSEVTDMLHRVFVGAWHKEEYSAAHNAAFSLARLYGHVTDKSTVEVIRRPSRDPDAPSEQALSSWVNSLPIIDHEPQDAGENAGLSALSRAPADLLGTPANNLATPATNPPTVAVSSPTAADNLVTAADNPAAAADNLATPATSPPPAASDLANVSNGLGLATAADGLDANESHSHLDANASHSHLDWLGKSSDFNDLAVCSRSVQAGGRPENGAPAQPVTGTPAPRAGAGLLETGTRPRRGSEKGAPLPTKQVPGYPEGFEWPPADELF